jgi:uncharacterized membrane protein YhaH (DUF805 family)
VTFAGRAPRSEFWYFQLFAVCIVYLIPVGVYLVEPATGKVVGVAIVVITLLLHLPGLAVAVRRLHDRNRSGWHYLWMFVPFFGSIVLLIWWCQRGIDDDNRFGADPLR